MDKIIAKLKEETKELLEMYMEDTRQYVDKKFAFYQKVLNWNTKQWCNYLKLEVQIKDKDYKVYPSERDLIENGTKYYAFPDNFHNTKDAKFYHKLRDEAYVVVNRMGKEKFLERELKDARLHYEGSIKKTALRLIKKGLDKDNFRVTDKELDVNLSMTLIDDSGKKVRCFTIVARGEIQRPHYRYLVK